MCWFEVRLMVNAANARQLVSKAASGDVEAIGQITCAFGQTGSDPNTTYVGPTNIHSFLNASGADPLAAGYVPGNPTLAPAQPDLLRELPDKQLCDHLVQVYRENEKPYFSYTSVALDGICQSIWHAADGVDGDAAAPITNAAISLYAMVCTISLQGLPHTSNSFVTGFGDPLDLRRRFYAIAQAALTRSGVEESPDLARIDATVMMGLVRRPAHIASSALSMSQYLKNEGRASDNFLVHAQAVRCAQAMGLHREGGDAWGLSVHEEQLRKRTWWTVRSSGPREGLSLIDCIALRVRSHVQLQPRSSARRQRLALRRMPSQER
jgi:hypothetical protein